MILYSGPLSMFGAKAEIAALEKGLPVEVVLVPFTADHRYEPKHPDVLRVNPKRQVPVLLAGPVEIFDSTQIFEYFEHLRPQPALSGRVQQTVDRSGAARLFVIESRGEIEDHARGLLVGLLGLRVGQVMRQVGTHHDQGLITAPEQVQYFRDFLR